MNLQPPRTTACRRATILVFLALGLGCTISRAATASEPAARLRALASTLRGIESDAQAGVSVDPARLVQVRKALAGLRNAGIGNTPFAAKFLAVQRLLGEVADLSAHPAAKAAAAVPSRGRLDLELKSSGHGDACANALGLSQDLPVRVMLGAGDSDASAVWFRFLPRVAGSYRFATRSSGTDPAIEIFADCASPAVASNDDLSGIDAAVATTALSASPLFVRLSNSGPGGPVDLNVEATTATISGKVTDAVTGLPLAGVQVEAASTWFFVFKYYATTQPDGTYSLLAGTGDPGDYFVAAKADTYVQQMYPSIECKPSQYYGNLSGCPTGGAQVFSNGTSVTDVDFALDHGHAILGQLRDTANQPLYGTVTLYDQDGNTLTPTLTDAAGHYFFDALPAGDYKVAAQSPAHGSKMFDGVDCGGPLQTQCDPAQATPLQVTDHDLPGTNFALPLLASIGGTVTGTGGTPLTYGSVVVLDGSGNSMSFANVDQQGHYTSDPLAPGSYYAYAASGLYFAQLYAGLDCPQSCAKSLAAATPITIDYVGQQVQADFQLHALPVFHGHVQDADTGLPLSNVLLLASDTPPADFNQVGLAETDNNGDYSFNGLSAGTYYIWAVSFDHIDQVYPDVDCEVLVYSGYNPTATCDASGAVLLTIASGAQPPVFNFALKASSTIHGTTRINAGPGSNMMGTAHVTIYDSGGATAGTAQADASGHYSVLDLAPGNYYAAASSIDNRNYVSQFWQGVDCPTACPHTTGSQVPIAQSSTVNGIDFSLTWRNAVVGRVLDQVDQPVAGVLVDLFASDGTYQGSGVTGADGYYAAATDSSASYLFATEAGGAYVDQVYSQIDCPNGPAYYGLCSLINGTEVAVDTSGTQPHVVNFLLAPQGTIFRNGFEPAP
jgi:protocatechuate 3,4-dioxygenase beta subunit